MSPPYCSTRRWMPLVSSVGTLCILDQMDRGRRAAVTRRLGSCWMIAESNSDQCSPIPHSPRFGGLQRLAIFGPTGRVAGLLWLRRMVGRIQKYSALKDRIGVATLGSRAKSA